MTATLTEPDRAAIRAQIGRRPRDLVAVAHRCACGNPDVVATAPRLADGSPFPTFYYLTCPRAASAVGTLEASGLMQDMTRRLADDPELRLRYERAHAAYLRDRAQWGDVPEIAERSAGGMPSRVKCLHALVAQSLACGPGVNPFGDDALAQLPDWGAGGPCTGRAGSVEDEER